MKTILFAIATTAIIFLSSCKPEQEFLSPEQILKEKEAVQNVIKTYNDASEDRNFAKIVETLAEEVKFFGTDSAEIITTFPQFKEAIQLQWDEYERINYGHMQDVFIDMDPNGQLATIMYGQPVDLFKNGVHKHVYVRVQRTLKKQKGNWLIYSGIMGLANNTKIIPDQTQEEAPAETTETK
jgi:ketosteroid isomerase-like protein